ncbi:hypothetical protein HK102_009530 [Quaeritorhiza haematococci]|nr:hypothetical protein HK102_009530 [Quaeritorhiza haematococci]
MNAENQNPAPTLVNGSNPETPKQPGVVDVIKNIKMEEFKVGNVMQLPCSKKALIYGSGAGLSIGVARYALTRSLKSSGNWAFIAFAAISVSSWEYCRFQRRIVQQQLRNMSEPPSKAE